MINKDLVPHSNKLDIWLACHTTLLVFCLQGTARPSGRSGHGMALTKLQDNKPGLIVFGGRSKGDLLHNDTWALELPGFGESGAA